MKPSAGAKGDKRFNSLSDEERIVRLEKAKAILFEESPFLASVSKGDSKIHEKMIRARVIRDLETEPMDLLFCDPGLLTKYLWYKSSAQNLRV